MKLAQALSLAKGTMVCSPDDRIPFMPRRITDVWISANRLYVRIRIAAVSKEWIGVDRWMPVPDKARWDDRHATWRDQNNRAFCPKVEHETDTGGDDGQ